MEERPAQEPADEPARPEPNRALRIVLGVLAAVVIVYVLFTIVFPWFQEYQDDPTLEGSGSGTAAVVVVSATAGW